MNDRKMHYSYKINRDNVDTLLELIRDGPGRHDVLARLIVEQSQSDDLVLSSFADVDLFDSFSILCEVFHWSLIEESICARLTPESVQFVMSLVIDIAKKIGSEETNSFFENFLLLSVVRSFRSNNHCVGSDLNCSQMATSNFRSICDSFSKISKDLPSNNVICKSSLINFMLTSATLAMSNLFGLPLGEDSNQYSKLAIILSR